MNLRIANHAITTRNIFFAGFELRLDECDDTALPLIPFSSVVRG
jgi:hypothetical protein